MRRKRGEARCGEMMAKKINLLLLEDTLGRIDVEAIFCKNGENSVEVRKVLCA
jgi:hypothetical protein